MNIGDVVYTKGEYQVEIGLPPITHAEPFPIPVYLVKNTRTGVVENMHNTLYGALMAADGLQAGLEHHAKQEQVPQQMSLFPSQVN